MRIKKNDEVEIISGDHRGKTGKVLKILSRKNRVVIEGVNMVKRHTKPTQKKQGGILEKEAPIHVSNVRKID